MALSDTVHALYICAAFVSVVYYMQQGVYWPGFAFFGSSCVIAPRQYKEAAQIFLCAHTFLFCIYVAAGLVYRWGYAVLHSQPAVAVVTQCDILVDWMLFTGVPAVLAICAICRSKVV